MTPRASTPAHHASLARLQGCGGPSSSRDASRALTAAHHARAQASSLYLFFYYTGSAVIGSVGGLFWSAHGWRGVATFVGALLVAALALSLWLARLQPRPHPSAA